jgi:hypothetical protein
MPQAFAEELSDLADRLSRALERKETCQVVERVAFRLAGGVFSQGKVEVGAHAQEQG